VVSQLKLAHLLDVHGLSISIPWPAVLGSPCGGASYIGLVAWAHPYSSQG
jgi:hypothetical protein